MKPTAKKKPTAKARRAVRSKPAQVEARPVVRLDVHPNVIIAHEGDDSAPLFRHTTMSGTMKPETVLDLIILGFNGGGQLVKVTRFDAQGQEVR